MYAQLGGGEGRGGGSGSGRMVIVCTDLYM